MFDMTPQFPSQLPNAHTNNSFRKSVPFFLEVDVPSSIVLNFQLTTHAVRWVIDIAQTSLESLQVRQPLLIENVSGINTSFDTPTSVY